MRYNRFYPFIIDQFPGIVARGKGFFLHRLPSHIVKLDDINLPAFQFSIQVDHFHTGFLIFHQKRTKFIHSSNFIGEGYVGIHLHKLYQVAIHSFDFSLFCLLQQVEIKERQCLSHFDMLLHLYFFTGIQFHHDHVLIPVGLTVFFSICFNILLESLELGLQILILFHFIHVFLCL